MVPVDNQSCSIATFAYTKTEIELRAFLSRGSLLRAGPTIIYHPRAPHWCTTAYVSAGLSPRDNIRILYLSALNSQVAFYRAASPCETESFKLVLTVFTCCS